MVNEMIYNCNDKIIEIREYEEMPKTEEEIKQEKKEEITAELKYLDGTINRATEDLYNLTNTTPYKSTQEVIDRKEVLRARLKELNR